MSTSSIGSLRFTAPVVNWDSLFVRGNPVTNVTNVTVVNYTVTPVTPKAEADVNQNILYGHPIAICDLGLAKLGADIISGPWINDGTTSGIFSFGLPTNLSGTRKLYKIFFDSQLAWESAAGGTVPADGTFLTEAFDFLFYGGSLTQAADPLETTNFPTEGIAYRPQMLLAVYNLPNTRFKKPVPFVAGLIGDTTDGADPTDGVNLATGVQRIAYTPWGGYTSSTFVGETGSDVVDAILVKDNFTMPDLCAVISRGYRNLDLIQSDKLYYRDLGESITPVFTFDHDNIIGGDDPISIERSPPSDQPRELEVGSIDPDQDYTVVNSLATQARHPVVVSASSGRDSFFLPVVIGADARQAIAAYALFYEENARKRIQFTVTAKGYEIEPGDIFAIESLADGIEDEAFKVIETSHSPNYSVGVIGEALLRCAISLSDPYFNNVVLLAGFEEPDGTTVYNEESSGKAVTFAGNASITTAVAKYGLGSLNLDYSSFDTVSLSDTDDWDLSNGNSDQFTIEMFVQWGSRADILGGAIISWWGASGARSWSLDLTTGTFPDPCEELTFSFSTDGTTITTVNTSGAELADDTWYWIVVTKNPSGKIRIRVDGVVVGSSTPADSSFFNPASPLALQIGTGPGGFMRGRLDEIRITKGVDRYDTDAAVSIPSGPFPRS